MESTVLVLALVTSLVESSVAVYGSLETVAISQMGQELREIPFGGSGVHVVSLNVAYNEIHELQAYAFYVRSYKNVYLIELGHNRIRNVNVAAFKELRQLETLDLSSNNITDLDPNTFKHNLALRKLDVASNHVIFNSERPFLRSLSLEVVVLTRNDITHVFDVTFSRLPNLRQLLLDDNGIYYMSRNAFAKLSYLQYLSLAKSGVHTISDTMFKTLPRLVDLSNTPLAYKFNPPLTRVRSGQLEKLIDAERFILEDDYDT